MKNLNITISLFFVSFLFSCGPKISDLQKYVASEKYPQDTFLNNAVVKRALVIVAHDDDDCAMSGTISILKAAGWEMKQLSLKNTPLEKKRTTHPSEIICQGNELILGDGDYRNGMDTTKYPYIPFSKEKFSEIFKTEKVAQAIIKLVNDFHPSVIFTLDNEIGGYGHPEHVFISQLVLDLAKMDSIHPQRIYQSVFTNHMELEINVKKNGANMKKYGFPDPYLLGKEIYKVDGMPEPTVEINIFDQAENKMKYLRAYSEKAKKNLRKFIPNYEDFDAQTYFKIFDREFFRVIEIK